MPQVNFLPDATVHTFVEALRNGNSRQLFGDVFNDTRDMEEIAQTPPDSDRDTVYKAVLSVVEQIDDPKVFGLGLRWLDKQGYGQMSMQEVLRLRGGTLPGD